MNSIPIYDYSCESCGNIHETVKGIDVTRIKCPACGKTAKRIISLAGVNTINEDAGWIKGVLEVVDKQGQEPETKEFLRNPTRSNYKAWMKARGLRHYEPGEENTRPEPVNQEDKRRRMKYVMDNYQKRNALEVRT
uniref:Putative regulatory protein FmdB zinc ribbon domain-containing protein n=1 Tax=viral metagenome TaxID=1070528 RepID=A0A6M3JW57_9ZZZZ